MKAVTKFFAGAAVAAVAAGAFAAPAAAQYYPPYGGSGNVVGQVLNQVLGGGYQGNGYNNGYNNSQALVGRCAAAVTQRINQRYSAGYNPYGGYGAYGNQYNAGARVLGVNSVERRSNGGLRVRGIATTNTAYGNYGYNGYGGYGGNGGYGGYGGYNAQPVADISFKCNVDYRGYVTDIDLDRNRNGYAYNPYGYRGY